MSCVNVEAQATGQMIFTGTNSPAVEIKHYLNNNKM